MKSIEMQDNKLFPDFTTETDSYGKYQPTTKRGYDLYEVVSALQKTIRRNLPEEAVYWALELFDSGFAKYLWKRMLIISAEDINSPETISAVKTLHDNYFMDKEKPHRIYITRAVLLLCESPKNRNADHYQNLNDYNKEKREIPMYALDKHTLRGKKMGRTKLDFFENEQKSLSPLVESENDKEVYNKLIDKIKSER